MFCYQEGKKQMYKLGKFLRRRYQGFISDKYYQDDLYTFSSDHDRCLMSAQVCLAGLYPPIEDQIWNDDINWQPIPVHTIPRNLDKVNICHVKIHHRKISVCVTTLSSLFFYCFS